MLENLMKYGFVETGDRNKIVLLREMFIELKHKGHALHFSEEIEGGQLIKVSVYHYLSCIVCQPGRRIS